MMCGLLLEACMKLGHSERERLGVYGLGGGLRSQELCRVLWSMGIEVLRLEGGYRAYREFILRDMKSLFILSLIGEKIGINQRYYLYEVLFGKGQYNGPLYPLHTPHP